MSTGHVSQVRFWVRPVVGQTQGLDYDQLLQCVILDSIGSDRKLFTTLKSALSSSILPAPPHTQVRQNHSPRGKFQLTQYYFSLNILSAHETSKRQYWKVMRWNPMMCLSDQTLAYHAWGLELNFPPHKNSNDNNNKINYLKDRYGCGDMCH